MFPISCKPNPACHSSFANNNFNTSTNVPPTPIPTLTPAAPATSNSSCPDTLNGLYVRTQNPSAAPGLEIVGGVAILFKNDSAHSGTAGQYSNSYGFIEPYYNFTYKVNCSDMTIYFTYEPSSKMGQPGDHAEAFTLSADRSQLTLTQPSGQVDTFVLSNP